MKLDQALSTILVRPRPDDIAILERVFTKYYGMNDYVISTVDNKEGLVKYIAITVQSSPFGRVNMIKRALSRMNFKVYRGA